MFWFNHTLTKVSKKTLTFSFSN